MTPPRDQAARWALVASLAPAAPAPARAGEALQERVARRPPLERAGLLARAARARVVLEGESQELVVLPEAPQVPEEAQALAPPGAKDTSIASAARLARTASSPNGPTCRC